MADENRMGPGGGAANERQDATQRGRDGQARDRETAAGAGGGVSIPRGTDEHSDDATRSDDVPARQLEPDAQLGASRRDPTR